MNLFFYFFKEMGDSLYRSKLVTSISIVTIGVLLFFLICLSLIILNVRRWVVENENQPQMSVYFNTNLSQEQESDLLININSVANAKKSKFITREESYNIFQSLYGSEMLSAVDENPFPAVLELNFPEDLPSGRIDFLSRVIDDFNGVESVVYSHEWMKKLQNFRSSISFGLAAFSIIMILVVFFTIMNTIKLTVYAREDMIRNMQYIGASGWYIRTPFVLEGIVQGMLGAFIALAAIVPVKLIVGNFNFYWGNMRFVVGIIFFGAVLGFLGSFFAVKKFIKL
jgi:cell division transport system permease protein